MKSIFKTRKPLALSYDTLFNKQILALPKYIWNTVRPEKYTKRRVNGDPWDLEKWYIIELLSSSSDVLYFGGQQNINGVHRRAEAQIEMQWKIYLVLGF